jgi:hypothetical protein
MLEKLFNLVMRWERCEMFSEMGSMFGDGGIKTD